MSTPWTVNGLAIGFDIVWAITCTHAFVRGGGPERIVGAALFVAAPLSWAVANATPSAFDEINLGLLTVDATLLAVLLGVALPSARYWPMALASMHAVGVLGHVAKPLAPDIVPDAYYALVAWWGFPMQLLLSVGTERHRRRLKRFGRDPAWMRQLSRAYRSGEGVHDAAPDGKARGRR